MGVRHGTPVGPEVVGERQGVKIRVSTRPGTGTVEGSVGVRTPARQDLG